MHITIEYLLLQRLPTLDVPNMKRITCNYSSLDQDSSIRTSSLALLFFGILTMTTDYIL